MAFNFRHIHGLQPERNEALAVAIVAVCKILYNVCKDDVHCCVVLTVRRGRAVHHDRGDAG